APRGVGRSGRAGGAARGRGPAPLRGGRIAPPGEPGGSFQLAEEERTEDLPVRRVDDAKEEPSHGEVHRPAQRRLLSTKRLHRRGEGAPGPPEVRLAERRAAGGEGEDREAIGVDPHHRRPGKGGGQRGAPAAGEATRAGDGRLLVAVDHLPTLAG